MNIFTYFFLRISEANSRPKRERKTVKATETVYDNFDNADSGYTTTPSPGQF